ncbi:hypothetical protein DNK06_19720 [Pseudomonas daroniae]|uniref:DUF5629 domain-containing protein n=1 Tax=Phytopseudomonas daroniae TaxID=2487519 RepID=A0A4Q9QID3_9GAMM|nr:MULTISPECIES: DUF5629 family protein [Pseudomonas]TBU73617.1 hypothetical protein DNK10_17245 [Pseudomonas daroniae]TBU73901.1 hypothetical protein DNK06_19720 [Pseudomonas daroniae]TBU74910.1 hypothetical protein DNK31_23615 [Pseudomonas sp. FRB 228]TBU88761.1 hypothetical protein DNJ99_18630 [Pseudomonas daroniae]
MSDQPYLLDQLETADMLEIDGLHAFDFRLDDALLDQADTAAEADEPFASEATVLHIEVQDGRERKRWQFSYNAVMEAEYRAADDSWMLGEHRLICLTAIGVEAD